MYTSLTMTHDPNGKVRLTGPYQVTRKPYSVVVEPQGLLDYWKAGLNAQEAFPELSAEEREFLISGVSPEGWKLIFGESNSELEQTDA